MSPESTVPIHPHPHCSLNSYCSISVQFFSQVAPHFCQHTIHQVIWPTPGALVPYHQILDILPRMCSINFFFLL